MRFLRVILLSRRDVRTAERPLFLNVQQGELIGFMHVTDEHVLSLGSYRTNTHRFECGA